MNGLLLLVLFGVVTLVTVVASKKSPVAVQPKAKAKPNEPEVTEESEAIKRMKELKEQGFEGILN